MSERESRRSRRKKNTLRAKIRGEPRRASVSLAFSAVEQNKEGDKQTERITGNVGGESTQTRGRKSKYILIYLA